MKKGFLFLFICILFLCACKTAKDKMGHTMELADNVPIDPHIPTIELTFEKRVEGIKNSISGLTDAYNKMKMWEETTSDYSKGMEKAAEIESSYGKRIEEITSLVPEDLTEEELINLSFEISDLVSKIRAVNDLFEFR